MKRQLFLYLFVFTLLFSIFLFVNSKNTFESQLNTIESLEKKLEKAGDSIAVLNSTITEIDYFTLQGNENAMSYLEHLGFEVAAVENQITEMLYDQNAGDGDHPLVPYEAIQGSMKINKVKFLNHRWIIVDFTDGQYWGEMILEYFFNENNELEIDRIASLLYPG